MSVYQITPNDSWYATLPWTTTAMTFTVTDKTTGDPIDLTDSVWDVVCAQLDPTNFTTDIDLSQASVGQVTATLSLGADTPCPTYFVWYLVETTVIVAPILSRRVDQDVLS